MRKRKKIPKMPGHRFSVKKQLLCSMLAGLLLACTAIWWINCQLDPMVLAVSDSRFSNQMELILCKTLNEATASSLSYGDLVQLQYDKAGKLVAVTTGLETGNLLRSRIVNNMLNELTALEDETISVPVGSLSALTFLSGLGWEIPVRLLGVTNVDSSFDSSLTSRGINQTLHEIDLVVKADLILLLPGGPRSTTVTSRIPMAETVLLGDVPEAYTYFSQFDSPEDAANAYNDYAAGKQSCENGRLSPSVFQ